MKVKLLKYQEYFLYHRKYNRYIFTTYQCSLIFSMAFKLAQTYSQSFNSIGFYSFLMRFVSFVDLIFMKRVYSTGYLCLILHLNVEFGLQTLIVNKPDYQLYLLDLYHVYLSIKSKDSFSCQTPRRACKNNKCFKKFYSKTTAMLCSRDSKIFDKYPYQTCTKILMTRN